LDTLDALMPLCAFKALRAFDTLSTLGASETLRSPDRLDDQKRRRLLGMNNDDVGLRSGDDHHWFGGESKKKGWDIERRYDDQGWRRRSD
jgi:hypothetical protein